MVNYYGEGHAHMLRMAMFTFQRKKMPFMRIGDVAKYYFGDVDTLFFFFMLCFAVCCFFMLGASAESYARQGKSQ